MINTIGIIGCGWLGLPLAKTFLTLGYHVCGSTTSEEKINDLKKVGVTPFLIILGEDKIEGDITRFLRKINILIINVPPKLGGDNQKNYSKKMNLLGAKVKASGINKVLFVSSISVYGNMDGEVTENTPPQPVTESGKQLLASENIFRPNAELQTTIVRFGGLIGPNRHPVTHLAGKKELPNRYSPVNLIHLNDCIRMIKIIVEQNHWNQIFNGVFPEHPTKMQYYTLEALKRGLKIPGFKDGNGGIRGKIIKCKGFLDKKQVFFTSITS